MDINALHPLAIQGDSSAENELFELLLVRFRYLANQRIWDRHDAEEVVQLALMTVLKEFKTIEIERSFAAWACKVLDNKVLSQIQKSRRQHRMLSDEYSEDHPATPEVEDPELRKKLLACLRKIGKVNSSYARILTLHYQGYTTKEICTKLAITPNNLYVTLSRARTMLASCLELGETKS